jgi:sister-chromatid-cohesion protein PDS5
LEAGKACLKLLSIPAYASIFESLDFCKIGLLIQDPVYHVRVTFIEQLCNYVGIKTLPPKYSIWLLLAAHEPEIELKQKVKMFLVRRAKFLRQGNLF